MKMKSLMAAGFLMAACSSEPVEIKKGEKFTFNGQEMTVDYKVSSVLSNDEDRITFIAPEGKAYILVDVSAKDDSYFSSLKDGETSVKDVSDIRSNSFTKNDFSGGDQRSLYLVDLANKNYTVQIKSYRDDLANLQIGDLKDEATIKVSERMNQFIQEFKDGAQILDVTGKYLAEGKTVFDVFSGVSGMLTKGIRIRYITPEGNYVCSTEFGPDTIEVSWDGDYISKIKF